MTATLNPFSNILTTLQADAKAQLLALATQTHANIAANPTPQNVTAQIALLAVSAPAQLPGMQTDLVLAANDAFLATITHVLTPAPVVAPVVTPAVESVA